MTAADNNNKNFTFTAEQVREIFRAGVSHGESRQSAWECGSSCHEREINCIVEAVNDIVNDGVKWDDTRRVSWDTIEGWFKAGACDVGITR